MIENKTNESTDGGLFAGARLALLRSLIADDAYAMTFQSLGQYRTALMDASPTAEKAGDLSDREIMQEWDRHYLPGEKGKTPFLSIVVKFARALLARPAAVGAGDMLEHAKSMQAARMAISELFQSAEAFMAIYDEGEAPDSAQEKALRDKIDAASNWLVGDVQACLARDKLLNRRAANGADDQKGGSHE